MADRVKKWLLEFFRDEIPMMKEGTIYRDCLLEGIQKGKEEGRRLASRRHVLLVLQERFDIVPPDVTRAVGSLSDVSLLEQLLHLAVKVLDLDQFREKLKAASATL